MSDLYRTGAQGVEEVARFLTARGRGVTRSESKTFDLVVDGVFAEVKSSNGPYARLGFIGLTDNQMQSLREGINFILFIVCNLSDTKNIEIIEIRGRDLLLETPKIECHHYWSRTQLDRIGRIASSGPQDDAQ